MGCGTATTRVSGCTISIFSVRGEVCTCRRSRRPIVRIAIERKMIQRRYAPTIEPISRGKYAGSLMAFLSKAGPSSADGEGALSMFMTQMPDGKAETVVKRV